MNRGPSKKQLTVVVFVKNGKVFPVFRFDQVAQASTEHERMRKQIHRLIRGLQSIVPADLHVRNLKNVTGALHVIRRFGALRSKDGGHTVRSERADLARRLKTVALLESLDSGNQTSVGQNLRVGVHSLDRITKRQLKRLVARLEKTTFVSMENAFKSNEQVRPGMRLVCGSWPLGA